MPDSTMPRWKKITGTTGRVPKHRYGHKAVLVKDTIVVFGGGNEEMINYVNVYNITTNSWSIPTLKGEEMPEGCASFGMVVDNTRILVFGGLVENTRYSNNLYELQTSRWKWKTLNPRTQPGYPSPCARFGHSFNLIGNKVYLFGGIANRSHGQHYSDNTVCQLEYLDDLYILTLHKNNTTDWTKPYVCGTPPHPRESHTAVSHVDSKGNSKLIIYGGMCGFRLGDVWMLDIQSLTWCECKTSGVVPLPRSFHTATVTGDKMYVFGGWVGGLVVEDDGFSIIKKRSTNELLCFNIKLMAWENLKMKGSDENIPKARAGHCAVNLNDKVFIWSGRGCSNGTTDHKVSYNDMWVLEIKPSSIQGRTKLVKTATNALEVSWPPFSNEEHYSLQSQNMILPPSPPSACSEISSQATRSIQYSNVGVVNTPTDPEVNSNLITMDSLEGGINTTKCENIIDEEMLNSLKNEHNGLIILAKVACSIFQPLLVDEGQQLKMEPL